MRKKIIFLFFVFAISSFPASAYYLYDKKIDKAFSLILNLKFNEAEDLLSHEKIENPGNDLRLLYLNYIDFLKAFISEDKNEFVKFKESIAFRLAELDNNKANFNSPFYLYSKSEILIQEAFAGLKFEANFQSVNEIRKAFKLIQENEVLYPGFILNKKIISLLNVIIGSVPSRFGWLVNLAGMKGDATEGILQLNNLYQNIDTTAFASYKTELLFYLGNIYSTLSTMEDSIPYQAQMKSISGQSPLIAYVYSNILMKKGENEKAGEVLKISIDENPDFPFYLFYYKKALTDLRKLDLNSETDFNFFLDHFKGVNTIKSCYQKIAWIALIKGDTLKYFNTMKLCKANGKKNIDEDKDAGFEAESKEIPNVVLLKSRLLFDGGYYSKSLNELRNYSPEKFPLYRDNLETTYRLGRIMQVTGQTEKAIKYFEMTINAGENSKYYFAANSSLMLGIIYEQRKDFIHAREYFQKCFKMHNDEYRNSIEQKAKAGIDRIGIK